jgi:hypothetical protein
VLAVIVAVMLVVLAVLVTDKVWSIIKKKEQIKDSYNFHDLQEKGVDGETDVTGLVATS